MLRSITWFAALSIAMLASPASATCTRPVDAPLSNAAITLVSPTGKTLQRTTSADGTLTLRGLKRGVWTAKLLGETQGFTMHVARNGRLQLRAMVQSYSCSPPGGPVHHSQNKKITQINLLQQKSQP